jgi:transposase
MQHIQGSDRNQLLMLSLEEAIDKNSFVRVVDAFVDVIDLKSFGFSKALCKEEGRPAYHPAVLMKLYLYGYRHGIRTSRKLQREAQTNLEAIWLLKGLHPKYKTIADFRKNNAKPFRAVFRKFALLLKEWDLIEGNTIAIDSFKIRASNSLKNNFNDKKLQRHFQYIDEQIAAYQARLDAADKEEDKAEARQKIEKHKNRKQKYEAIQKELEASREQQISLTDPDARSVVLHRNIINVGYNIQASSDQKHKLMVEFDTGQVNDTHALAPMARQTRELLQSGTLTVLADKGYHSGQQLAICEQAGITTYVSPKEPATNDSEVFPVSDFIYHPTDDFYICPAGEMMTTNNTWHSHSAKGYSPAFRFRRFTTTACKICPIRQRCTKGKANGRAIDRSEFAEAVEENNRRVNENPDYYRKRQQITEHQFGTMKRQMGFTFTLVRGKPKVLAEVALIFTVYNLVRCASILNVQKFINALKQSICTVFNSNYRLFWPRLNNFVFLTFNAGTEFYSP